MTDITTINETFESMSGLEFVQHAARTGLDSPMARIFGLKIVEAADGMAKVGGTPGLEHYNPMKRVHGGFAATMIDNALGSAVLTKLPQGVGAGTVQLNINFVHKIEVETGPVIAEAHVLHAGRSMLTAECKLRDAHGRLLAHGTGTFMVYAK